MVEGGSTDITVVIVNWNTKELLLECLSRIYETLDSPAYEVFVVDNASVDGSVAAVRKRYPGVNLIVNPKNFGYAAACNQALRQMKGRYALLLNTDALPEKGAVKHLFDFMEKTPSAGMACAQLLHSDGRCQNSVAPFPSWVMLLTNEGILRALFPSRFTGKRRAETDPVEVDSCIGACMIVRKSAMDAVGLLDERYFFFFEETDWALRMHGAGWKIFFVPKAEVIHRQGQSVGFGVESRKLFYRARYAYFQKWYPQGFLAIYAVVFFRLLVNAVLTALGVFLTLGLAGGLRRRLGVYLKLIAWHLTGCPKPISICR
jgi:GT2 family glycosyltransferase